MKHFVAKLVKSFGGICNAAESLDDFRYRKVRYRKVGFASGKRFMALPEGTIRDWGMPALGASWAYILLRRVGGNLGLSDLLGLHRIGI